MPFFKPISKFPFDIFQILNDKLKQKMNFFAEIKKHQPNNSYSAKKIY